MEIEGVPFTKICTIAPQLNSSGAICEFYPAEHYDNTRGLRLNDYGHGPFCEFRIPDSHPDVGSLHCPGVYALADESKATLYIGRCTGESKGHGTLVDRYNTGYGHISPRNCYMGGQSTNCRINNLILESCKQGHSIALLFHPTPNGDSASHLEADFLNRIRTTWNRSVPNYPSPDSSLTPNPEPKSPRQETERRERREIAEVVRQEVIEHWITPARNRGEREVTVLSGDVHKRLGLRNRYRAVCSALRYRKEKFEGQARVELVSEDSPRDGANITFIYRLL